MRNCYLFYWSIWCPIEKVRDCIKNSQDPFKEMMDHIKIYGDKEGIVFLELTEDAIKNLPVLMVDNMRCFAKDNIDTMVFSIKEIKCKNEYDKCLIDFLEDCMIKLLNYGFKSEVVVIKEIKIEEQNTGKTVGRKDYEIQYHKQFI